MEKAGGQEIRVSGARRTHQKITGKAATYAFFIGSYFMIALMAANLINLELTGSPLLDTGYALVVSLLVQSLTFLGLRLYFNRKGEL